MITLIVTLIIVGVLWYLVEHYLPLAPPMVVILRAVLIIATLLYVARFFGIV